MLLKSPQWLPIVPKILDQNRIIVYKACKICFSFFSPPIALHAAIFVSFQFLKYIMCPPTLGSLHMVFPYLDHSLSFSSFIQYISVKILLPQRKFLEP